MIENQYKFFRMSNRRKFISKTLIGWSGLKMGAVFGSLGIASSCRADSENTTRKPSSSFKPVVVSTWKNEKANSVAWDVIAKGGKSVDAVEAGVQVPEADPNDTSVGFGGRPDRDGNVTLDACIMDESGNAGSVCFLQGIKHPIAVARKVMDETPHVILAGAGAKQFAIAKGFKEEKLLTEASRKHWEEWKKTSQYKPIINIENHDTIGMVAIDKNGDLSGACTTSGLAYKMQGRVGDSPIIGAGLFVDNEIGAATSTGMGEAVLKTLGSFLVVELMRQGKSPQEACEEAVHRIAKKQSIEDFQVGYLAINKAGEVGAYSIHSGFNYQVTGEDMNDNFDAKSMV